jgi:Polysaccharide deacetylase
MDVPEIVTDTTKQRWSRRRFMGGALGVAALGSFAAACGRGADQPASAPTPGAAASLAGGTRTSHGSATTASGVDAELIRRRYQGLKPFAPAPAPPAVKPITLTASDPTVFSHVPMTDKVVFVTIDDGIEKDPRFIQMVKDKLRKEYGTTPYIFRPPGGSYDATTIAAASEAGLKGLMLWKEAMQITDMKYQTSARTLSPGDIILCHFRGPAQLRGETMVHMMIRLYKHIQAQGFTVADVTQYV